MGLIGKPKLCLLPSLLGIFCSCLHLLSYLTPPLSWIDKATVDLDVGLSEKMAPSKCFIIQVKWQEQGEYALHFDFVLRDVKATPRDVDDLPFTYQATGRSK